MLKKHLSLCSLNIFQMSAGILLKALLIQKYQATPAFVLKPPIKSVLACPDNVAALVYLTFHASINSPQKSILKEKADEALAWKATQFSSMKLPQKFCYIVLFSHELRMRNKVMSSGITRSYIHLKIANKVFSFASQLAWKVYPLHFTLPFFWRRLLLSQALARLLVKSCWERWPRLPIRSRTRQLTWACSFWGR